MKQEICSIYLDCKLTASLDFQQEKKRAQDAIEQGLKLCFELDFGISPLFFKSSEILSFQLALKHFEETFFLEFKDDVEMVFLYKGDLNFAKGKKEENSEAFLHWLQLKSLDFSFCSNEALFSFFCRDQIMEVLRAITLDFSDMPFSLLLDASQIEDPFLLAFLAEKKHFSPFQVLLIGKAAEEEKAPLAISLPSFEEVLKKRDKSFENLFDFFTEKKIAYRTISESCLLTEWHLVDFLFASSSLTTQNGKRMLQGFLAAGGTLVTLGAPFELDGEIPFPEFIIQYIK
ncbi:MAG TPA: hypothetical protein PLC42_08200 [Parachlamydiaceae bacterium]|nr:hypothetical protein [Parachlamydiaceae bacterium]